MERMQQGRWKIMKFEGTEAGALAPQTEALRLIDAACRRGLLRGAWLAGLETPPTRTGRRWVAAQACGLFPVLQHSCTPSLQQMFSGRRIHL